jgi:hypothetical protein
VPSALRTKDLKHGPPIPLGFADEDAAAVTTAVDVTAGVAVAVAFGSLDDAIGTVSTGVGEGVGCARSTRPQPVKTTRAAMPTTPRRSRARTASSVAKSPHAIAARESGSVM